MLIVHDKLREFRASCRFCTSRLFLIVTKQSVKHDSTMDAKFVLRVRKSDFLPVAPSTSLSRTPRLPSTTGSGNSARRLLLSCLILHLVPSRVSLSAPAPLAPSRLVYTTSAVPRNFIEFAAERAAFHGQLWRPTLFSPSALYSAILNPPTYNPHPPPIRDDETRRKRDAGKKLYACVVPFSLRLPSSRACRRFLRFELAESLRPFLSLL